MERCNAGLSFWIVRSCVHKHADPPLGLLRSRGKRPSSRYTADKRDEIASPHWLPLQQRVLPYHGDRRIVHHGKFGQPMSAMGQKRTFCTATKIPLFDHLVRGGEQRLRDVQPQRLGGLEIDDQLELGRLLDGDVTRLGTPENFVD